MRINWKLASRNLYYTLLGLIGLTATWKFIIYQPSSREVTPAKSPPKYQAQRTLARKLQLRAEYFCRLCRQPRNRFSCLLPLHYCLFALNFESQTTNEMSVKYKIRDQQGLHFFTCTICGWVDLFSRTVFREVILDSWRYCQEHKGLQIWGYVFMTNHIHFIANAKDPGRLEDILRDFKAHTAKKILELLHDNKTQESRREWLLYLFQYFGKRLKNAKHQVWIHDNHPIELYSEAVVIQKLRYIHNNPVEANWVRHPEDWIYSSASNYAEGKGIFEVQLLWTGFEEDGGWFFGNVDYPTLD